MLDKAHNNVDIVVFVDHHIKIVHIAAVLLSIKPES